MIERPTIQTMMPEVGLISEAEAIKEGGKIIKDNEETPFSRRLSRLRLDRDLKPSDVAKGTGLSLTAILGYEDGSQIPKMDSLCRLADFFDVAIDYLCGRTDLRRLPKDYDILMFENKCLEFGAFAERLRNDLGRRDGE